MVAQTVVLLLCKFACRRPSLIAIRLGQPKAKPSFRNLKGKTAILCIIGKPTQIGMLFSIGGQSVFEIGIVRVYRNPTARFIEENLGCTMSSMADAHFGIVKVELCVFH